jgi:putative phosphoserine phosphatase/1-acylglycerol-3-phosphate O-acyltransferase
VVGDSEQGVELAQVDPATLPGPSAPQIEPIGNYCLADARALVHTFTNTADHKRPPTAGPYKKRSASSPPKLAEQVERPRIPHVGPFPFSDAYAPAMGRSAAIFDLDRTLLAGASGPVLSRGLRTAGLVSGGPLPGEALLYGLFNRVGESLPAMALTRQAVALARGRSRAAVEAAAVGVAEELAALVQPYGLRLLEEHRREGRPLVLATTTPYDLIRPFGELLGFDEVIATRYGVNADGTYDGTLNGPFVWSTGKLAAVRSWARRAEVDLGASWFYTDSVYDLPLLGAVGHPVAVNPDARLAVVATLRRWPILHLDVPPGVPKVPVLQLEPQALALQLARPELIPFARISVTGTEHVPATGPAILVGNHRSYFDATAMAVAVARTGRTVRFLGKKEVFDAPVVGQIARAMGGIRVERGSGSDEPLRHAAEALHAGQLVAIMPQGTIPRGPAFFDPVLKGRWGAARLAAMTKAPVIPVGLWGTERVWPRSSRLPHVWNVLDPPAVTVRVGAEVPLRHRSPEADTKRLMQAIVDLLPAEARERHEPTAEELARTNPPGYRGDPGAEADRRPGTD